MRWPSRTSSTVPLMSPSAGGGWGGRTTWHLGNLGSFWHVPRLRWLVCLRWWAMKLQHPQWRPTKLQRTLGFLGWYASWRIHPWGRYGQLAFQDWLFPRRRCPFQSTPEPAPFREPTESAPEPAPFHEPTESAPEPTPFREPTESTPKSALFREPTESAPEPAPFRESE